MKAVIVGYARTPFQFARKGRLVSTRPETLLTNVLAGLVQRTRIPHEAIEDVIVGCAYPEGPQGNNIARIALLLAGLPNSIGGMTVNRFCASSMSAIHIAAAQIEAGVGQAYLCAGVESMSMVPQGGLSFDPHPSMVSPHSDAYISMGETAENVARRWGVSRADQERLALESHRKAAQAQRQGLFTDEILPISVADGTSVTEDGCIRPGTTLDALAALKPAFRPDGLVTAGTSSPLTDGAAGVVVVHEALAAKLGLRPLARIVTFASAGVDPDVMGIGPVPATQKVLERAGLKATDLDVVEINEAFASQALACIRELGLRMDTVNIDGGAMALGHPLGATGARITGKAAALLQRTGGRYALSTQCVGGGQGAATLLERVG